MLRRVPGRGGGKGGENSREKLHWEQVDRMNGGVAGRDLIAGYGVLILELVRQIRCVVSRSK